MLDRLAAQWVQGGALAGLLLLALTPVVTSGWPTAQALAWAALPAYMLHQWEEHDRDRFRAFVNEKLAGGRQALSLRDVFWINIVGVWAVLALGLWMTAADPGWAALAGWFLVVNGALHGVQALVLRCYNPGLATGLAVFLPLGSATLVASGADITRHAACLVAVLAIHGAVAAVARKGMRA
jgi:hypothetical protein